MRVRSVLSAVVVTALAAWGAVSPATATTTARYVGAGVGVVRAGGQTPADNGIVVCDTGDGIGSGGLCLPFGGGDAVSVVDDALGEEVAFQVCVDNNGDGFCSSPDPDPDCGDEIAFSHDDAGSFFNPVGPLPGGFKPGCPGGTWRGYVVLLCEGVHVAADAHAHPATTGTGTVTGGGEGLGTFCGGGRSAGPLVGRKAYAVSGGGNLTCGMSVSQDPQGEGSYTGGVVGGPWHVAGATGVVVTCAVQVNDDDFNGSDASRLTGPAVTAASFASGTVTFAADPDDVVYLCTEVEWEGATGGGSYIYDADPGKPGNQCVAAVGVDTQEFSSRVVPQTLLA